MTTRVAGGRSWRWNVRLVAAALLAAASLGCAGRCTWLWGKPMLAQLLLRRAFDASVAESRPVEPWPGAGLSVVARLDAPDAGLSTMVLADATERTLGFAPAVLARHASEGTDRNTVILGHRDTQFRSLENLEPGMMLAVTKVDGTHHTYRVDGTHIVTTPAEWLTPTTDATVTLITCYPFDWAGPAPLRYVVRAVRTQATEGRKRQLKRSASKFVP